MKIAFANTALAETAAVAAANVVALALLAGVAGYWNWQWLAPRPAASLPTQAEASGQGNGARELFGTASVEQVVAVPTGLSIRLLGVIAATEGRAAYAVVVLDDKQIMAVQK